MLRIVEYSGLFSICVLHACDSHHTPCVAANDRQMKISTKTQNFRLKVKILSKVFHFSLWKFEFWQMTGK